MYLRKGLFSSGLIIRHRTVEKVYFLAVASDENGNDYEMWSFDRSDPSATYINRIRVPERKQTVPAKDNPSMKS